MATVIDSLVVELGLDGRAMEEGERDALEHFRRSQRGFEHVGNQIEAQGRKISEMFGVLKRGAVGLIGAFVGEEAARFVDHVAAMDANTSRLSRSLGVNIENLSTWEGMVRKVGGTAEDAQQTFATLTDTISGVRHGGGFFTGPFATLLNLSGANWRGGVDSMLRDIAGFLENEQKSGRMSMADARWWLQQIPGMTSSILNLLLKGTEGINEAAEAVRRQGVASKAAGEAAEEYQSQLGDLELALMNLARKTFPVLTTVIEGINKALEVSGRLLGLVGFMATRVIVGPKAAEQAFGDYDPHKLTTGGGEARALAAGSSPAAVEAYIRAAAIKRGINPDVAVAVARSESGLNPAAIGDNGTSFGLFQLHMGGGLGDKFGPNARNPNTWPSQVDFSLDEALRQGWGPWHGWHGLPRAGLPAVPTAPPGIVGGDKHSMNGDTTITIGSINVTSHKADPKDVAMEIPGAMKRASTTMPLNYGLS